MSYTKHPIIYMLGYTVKSIIIADPPHAAIMEIKIAHFSCSFNQQTNRIYTPISSGGSYSEVTVLLKTSRLASFGTTEYSYHVVGNEQTTLNKRSLITFSYRLVGAYFKMRKPSNHVQVRSGFSSK